MLAIGVSRADSASEHIGERLRAEAGWDEAVDESRPDADGGGTVYRLDDAELRTFETLHLETTGVAEAFEDPELLVFPSRHAGETEELLTAHHTGNFGSAEFGGSDGSVARACPSAHRQVLDSLAEYAPDPYEVGMECTHHGPSEVGVPSMFVEVGSDEPQWDDPDAARAVARAILDLRDFEADAPVENGARRHLVGFGGGHYAPRFERVVRETDWAVGHVASDWCLDAMGDPRESESVVEEAFEQSAAQYALLEADRPALRQTIESCGYRVVSETWVRETSGVALDLVERAEDAVGTVADGLRFGSRAVDYDGSIETTSLSADLLAEARGIDAGAVEKAVSKTAIAYDTQQNGTQVHSTVAVSRSDDVEAIIDELTGVLRKKYDDVTRADSELIARLEALDPDRADILDVPEGPKLGRLAAGETIEVNGRTIEPEQVITERERRFNC